MKLITDESVFWENTSTFKEPQVKIMLLILELIRNIFF